MLAKMRRDALEWIKRLHIAFIENTRVLPAVSWLCLTLCCTMLYNNYWN